MNIFKPFFKEYHQSVNQFGSKSGPTFTFCKAVCKDDLPATLTGKELTLDMLEETYVVTV